MSNSLSRLLLTAAFGLAVASWSAQAAPIGSSQISFDGSASLNGSLGTATSYTQIQGPSGSGGPIVNGASGSRLTRMGRVLTQWPTRLERPLAACPAAGTPTTRSSCPDNRWSQRL